MKISGVYEIRPDARMRPEIAPTVLVPARGMIDCFGDFYAPQTNL